MKKKQKIFLAIFLVMIASFAIIAFKLVSKINNKSEDNVYANERDKRVEMNIKKLVKNKNNEREVKADNRPYDGQVRGISFWGDSMTEGVGDEIGGFVRLNGEDYDTSNKASADTVGLLTGLDVFNMGRSGETSDEIARREGGLPMFTSEDIDVSNDPVRVDIVDEDDNKVDMDNFNGYGCSSRYHDDNIVYIDGLRYKVLFNEDGDSYIRRYEEFYENYAYLQKNGESIDIRPIDSNSTIHIPKGTKIRTAASFEHKDDILVIEIGSNGGWDDYDELISQIDDMLLVNDCDYYIIVGDTDDPGSSVAEWWESPTDIQGNPRGLMATDWENALENAYGDHFLNTRLYMIENALSDCGFETSDDDLDGYNFGRISNQLRYDWTHFNGYGYFSKALAIYNKGVSLGYWN